MCQIPGFEIHPMSTLSLNLVVLRVPDLERAVAFYSCLGLSFS
ncbi:MAG: hypothetical protein NTV51_25405 [Verrucomicrobia bacterium]|nr:hypothetical protein [Verrucomicrobiota bacterium]